MNKLLTVAMTAMLGTGCMRSLMIQPGDSSALAASKVAVRVPLAVVTAGMTEVLAGCVRNTARAEGMSMLPDSPAWDICNRGMAQFGAAMAAQSSGPSNSLDCQSTCVRVGGGSMQCTTHCR